MTTPSWPRWRSSTPSTAAALIRDARRPVVIVGHGARGAENQVRALAERLTAPALTTFKAKGLVPDTHPLGAGGRDVSAAVFVALSTHLL